MLHSNVRTDDRGFSMFEIAIVLLIVGILAAIAVPSFLSMLSKNNVNDALAKVQGILKEAQREAIRKSKTCTVELPEGNNSTITIASTTPNCIVTGDRTLTGINTDVDGNTATTITKQITFDFKGRTNVSSAATIVFASADATSSEKKCLAISEGLGIIRTGNFTDTGASRSAKCHTSR